MGDNFNEIEHIVYTKEMLKHQRHDYMNYFQIVYAYLQLGRTNDAINSIKKVIKLNENLYNIYNISLIHVSIYLDKMVRDLYNIGYMVNIEVENHTDYISRFASNEKDIVDILRSIYYNNENNTTEGERIFALKIDEFKDSIRFLFSGDNKMDFIDLYNDKCTYTVNNTGTVIDFNI